MKYLFLLILPILLIGGSYEKVALVIGNNSYNVGKLKLPIKDAKAIGAFLKTKGFKVVLLTNLTKSKMKKEIKKAKSLLKKGGVFLFYFSGHGNQVEKENFLVPIDNSGIDDKIDLVDKTISLKYIIGKMKTTNSRLNIVMIDACRNNPFAFSKGNKGLAVIKADRLRDTFIVFAGEEDTTIPDDGLFRKTFIKYANKSLSLGDLFTDIRNEFYDKGRNGIYTVNRARVKFKFSSVGIPAHEKVKTEITKNNSIDQVTPVTNIKTYSFEPQMVKISKGSFVMGSNSGEDDEKPTHKVNINYDFEIGKYEVTVEEFRKFVNDTSYKTEAETTNDCYIYDRGWEKKEVGKLEKIKFYTKR